jgi:hypothetical protein
MDYLKMIHAYGNLDVMTTYVKSSYLSLDKIALFLLFEWDLPKQALLYKPRGRRYVGRPRKRWTADVGTGDSPIP